MTLNNPNPDTNIVLNNIQQFSGEQFEQFIEEFWSELGWNTSLTPYTHDWGVDLIARTNIPVSTTMAIQAKQSTNPIPRTTVQQYASLEMLPGIDIAVLVTSGTFSGTAKTAAQQYGLRLVDGAQIVSLLEQTSNTNLVYRLLSRTTSSKSIEEKPSQYSSTLF